MNNPNVKQEYKQLVRESGIRLIDEGYTVSTWGNISFCDRETGLMYITPSGMPYHELVDDDICVYDLEGNSVDSNRKPSIEFDLHRAMFVNRPESVACIHTHPIYSTIFSSCGENIPINIHDEAAQTLGDDVKTADYALPGSQELCDNAVKAIGKKSNACLLSNHGAVCISDSMDGAFTVCTVLEMVAEIYWRIRSMNGTYRPICDENISIMQDFVKNQYGQK